MGRVFNSSCTPREYQVMPVVLQITIQKIPGISYSKFENLLLVTSQSQVLSNVPQMLLYQSSEFQVTLKAGQSALLGSDPLLKMTIPSLHSASSCTLLGILVTKIDIADVVIGKPVIMGMERLEYNMVRREMRGYIGAFTQSILR